MRKIARIVKIDDLEPIANADLIELAHVGGWRVVVKKGQFSKNDSAVYFEVDTFLPKGNPAWNFLMGSSLKSMDGVDGHVLKTIKARGVVSQGLLLEKSLFANLLENKQEEEDVSELLGVCVYEPPIPAELAGQMRGFMPSLVPKTNQERIQNLQKALERWKSIPDLTWEISEKLEGISSSFIWLRNELHVCSKQIDYYPSEENCLWKLAYAHDLEKKFKKYFKDVDIAIQGEVVGCGLEGNIYKFNKQKFFAYNTYDILRGQYLNPKERFKVLEKMELESVPIIEKEYKLSSDETVQSLLKRAEGLSVLKDIEREGLVFKSNNSSNSFKAISDKYLLKK